MTSFQPYDIIGNESTVFIKIIIILKWTSPYKGSISLLVSFFKENMSKGKNIFPIAICFDLEVTRVDKLSTTISFDLK